MGQATATEAAGGRKRYAITPEGEQALAAQQDALQYLLLARLAHGRARGERPVPIVRAIEKFRTALSLKLAAARPGRAPEDVVNALTSA